MGLSYQREKKFFIDAKYYVWEEPRLYKLCRYGFYQRSLAEDDVQIVYRYCYTSIYSGHFSLNKTINKILQAGFCWLTLSKDARKFVMTRN